jgi:hypothetical protein
MTPSTSFSLVAKRYSTPLAKHLNANASSRAQYGDVFTFILFGRRVTVALGAKGNNFILGGRSTIMSAEDAYTVSAVDPGFNYPMFTLCSSI